MTEVLLRRLVGAGVLLLAAFGLASLLPSPEPGTVIINDTSVGTGGERRVVVYDLQHGGRPVDLRLDGDLQAAAPAAPGATEPAPTAAPEAPADPAPEPPTPGDEGADGPGKEAPTPAPQPEVAAPAPASGRWSVQVASFADPDNARKARQRLVESKLRATVQEVRVGNATWFRVRVGPFTGEKQARGAEQEVKRLGFRGARLVEE